MHYVCYVCIVAFKWSSSRACLTPAQLASCSALCRPTPSTGHSPHTHYPPAAIQHGLLTWCGLCLDATVEDLTECRSCVALQVNASKDASAALVAERDTLVAERDAVLAEFAPLSERCIALDAEVDRLRSSQAELDRMRSSPNQTALHDKVGDLEREIQESHE